MVDWWKPQSFSYCSLGDIKTIRGPSKNFAAVFSSSAEPKKSNCFKMMRKPTSSNCLHIFLNTWLRSRDINNYNFWKNSRKFFVFWPCRPSSYKPNSVGNKNFSPTFALVVFLGSSAYTSKKDNDLNVHSNENFSVPVKMWPENRTNSIKTPSTSSTCNSNPTKLLPPMDSKTL